MLGMRLMFHTQTEEIYSLGAFVLQMLGFVSCTASVSFTETSSRRTSSV